MARTPQNFANTTQLGTSVGDIIAAVSSNTKAVVRKVSFFNTGASTRTVTVYVIASGGSAGTTNEFKIKAIPAGQSWNLIEIQGEVLSAGMKVQAKQDSGADINVNTSGVDIT
ncbi:MAG: hypothetical protein V3R25_09220 [Nitrosomonadaceae bacterium]